MRFRPNPSFRQQIEREAAYRQGLLVVARGVAAEANELGHRIMPKGRGPTIKAEADAEGVYVVNHAYGSHIDEWGSKNNPPYAPLRKGVRAAGLRFHDQ